MRQNLTCGYTNQFSIPLAFAMADGRVVLMIHLKTS